MKVLVAIATIACSIGFGVKAMADPPDDVLKVETSIPAESFTVGETYVMRLTITPAADFVTNGAGLAKSILQLDVPDSIELVGRVLTDPRELARNGFLQAPYARLVDDGDSEIEFVVKSEPAPTDRIGVNVLAYVQNESTEDVYFIRRRIDLPVVPESRGSANVMATRSTWGIGERLNIGDTIEPLTLPRADGSELAFEDAFGDGPVVVITYRAFW